MNRTSIHMIRNLKYHCLTANQINQIDVCGAFYLNNRPSTYAQFTMANRSSLEHSFIQIPTLECSELWCSGSVLAACGCRSVVEPWVRSTAPADSRPRPLCWLTAQWAFGFSGDHQPNIQCVLIYRWCVLIHVWCSLFSLGDKFTTTWVYK